MILNLVTEDEDLPNRAFLVATTPWFEGVTMFAEKGIRYLPLEQMWEELLDIDGQLDDAPDDPVLWRRRAETIYRSTLGLPNTLREETSRLIELSFNAAQKAFEIDKVETKVSCVIMSYYYYSKKNHEMAKSYLDKIRKCKDKDKNADAFLSDQRMVSVCFELEHLVVKKKKEKKKHEGFADQSLEPVDEEHGDFADQSAKQDEQVLEIPKGFDKIPIGSCCRYLLNPKREDMHYSGTRENYLGLSSRAVSFIPCDYDYLGSYLQRSEKNALQTPHILMHIDAIEASLDKSLMYFLVVEEVDSIEFYFKRMFDEFVEEKRLTIEMIKGFDQPQQTEFMKAWWEHIQVEFLRIIGELVEGILDVYSIGCAVGVSGDHLYVSKGKGKGKVLPFLKLDNESTYSLDIQVLKNAMKNIIYQPGLNLNFKKNFLPLDLESFMNLRTKNLTSVAAICALSHPCFSRSSAERINIMKKIRKLIQVKTIEDRDIGCVVGRMMDADHGTQSFWFHIISEPLMLSVLHYKEPGGCSKYTNDLGIERYFMALANHGNEHIPKYSKVIREEVYELKFRELFPNIYTYLFEFIFNICDANLKHVTRDELLEYFSKFVAP